MLEGSAVMWEVKVTLVLEGGGSHVGGEGNTGVEGAAVKSELRVILVLWGQHSCER